MPGALLLAGGVAQGSEDEGWTSVGRRRQDEAMMCNLQDAEKGQLRGQGRHPG